jgi:hypothetical protein
LLLQRAEEAKQKRKQHRTETPYTKLRTIPFSTSVLDYRKANAPNCIFAVFRFFRRNENQGLAFGTAPATPALAAKERLVHFDDAG